MADRSKLGQLLLGADVITEGQLAAALDEQNQTGRPLGMTLVGMGFLDEETLIRTLARQLSLPIAWIRGKKIRKSILELVPRQIVGAHRCVPVRVDDKAGERTLLLAMEDPADLAVQHEVESACGMRVRAVLATPSELEESILRHFPGLELAPSASDAVPRRLEHDLLCGIEGDDPLEWDDEDKDDACMSAMARPGGDPAAQGDAAPPDLDADGFAGGLGLGSAEGLAPLGPDLDSPNLDAPDLDGPGLEPLPGDPEAEPDALGAESLERDVGSLIEAPGAEPADEIPSEASDSASLELELDLEPGAVASDDGAELDFLARSAVVFLDADPEGPPEQPALELAAPEASDPIRAAEAAEVADVAEVAALPALGSQPLDSGAAGDPLGEPGSGGLLADKQLETPPAKPPPGFREDAPELVAKSGQLAGSSPLSSVSPPLDAVGSAPAASGAAAGLSEVGSEVVLRALSQLLVEKGVIAREELIARLAKLANRDDDPPDPSSPGF